MSKVLTIILISLTITTLISAQDCTPGCISCQLRSCNLCHKRMFKNRYECESELAPERENCEVYTENGCMWCKKGYVFSTISGSCEIEETGDCLAKVRLSSGTDVCVMCDGGYSTGNTCQKFKQGDDKNCMWGGKDGRCIRCFTGFTSEAGKCVKSTYEGCMRTSDTIWHSCDWCNFYEGYYALGEASNCVKSQKKTGNVKELIMDLVSDINNSF